jgi:hypothetical protein
LAGTGHGTTDRTGTGADRCTCSDTNRAGDGADGCTSSGADCRTAQCTITHCFTTSD